MKALRTLGSLAFVLGLFISVFGGIPWAVVASTDPVVPGWLRFAVFCLIGGILLVLITVALEQKTKREKIHEPLLTRTDSDIILSNYDTIPHRDIKEIVGVVEGHTVYAIWLGNDLSALIRLVLGGELTEYTEMMGNARTLAVNRMLEEAKAVNADAIINVRYMTTSVVGSAAELLAYGTAVKFNN